MATMQVGGRTTSAAVQDADSGRRRATRYPAGWLLVEADTGSNGRKLPGRLLDISAGGLGLVLDEEVTAGALVRISPTGANQPSNGPAWHGRQARVAYAAPLPGGSWRVGLTFAPDTHGGIQIWATRVLLLAVFAIATFSALYSDTAGSLGGLALGAIAVILAAGAEWQNHLGADAARYGPPKAIANR